jgi:hypothetical protein
MRFSNSSLRGLSFCSALAFASVARGEGEWLRHFRIGASAGLNISTEFKTTGTFALNTPPPSSRGGISYDDGFVGRDAFNTVGQTTFWGYNNASQVDDAAKTLTYHGTQSFSANGFNEADDVPLGFDMAYAGTFRQWERVSIGGELGFGLSVFNARDKHTMNALLQQKIDVYDTSQIIVPSAPYIGNDTGTGGPLLPTTPTSTSGATTAGTVSGSRSLEGILYSFRLGPMLRWEFYPRWTLNASGGGALGIFDATYKFDETISASANSGAHNKGKFGTTDVLYGGYAGAIVMWDSGDDWELYLGAHFMSLQDGKISSGGREATMHLDAAIYITAGINWSY